MEILLFFMWKQTNVLYNNKIKKKLFKYKQFLFVIFIVRRVQKYETMGLQTMKGFQIRSIEIVISSPERDNRKRVGGSNRPNSSGETSYA